MKLKQKDAKFEIESEPAYHLRPLLATIETPFETFFFKKFFQEYPHSIRVSNSLDSDQAQRFVGPYLCCKRYQQTTLEGKELKVHDCTKYFWL